MLIFVLLLSSLIFTAGDKIASDEYKSDERLKIELLDKERLAERQKKIEKIYQTNPSFYFVLIAVNFFIMVIP